MDEFLITTTTLPDPDEAKYLDTHDFVAISFWIISIAMMASTIFFFLQSFTVKNHWRDSLHVGGLVTFVAAVHYMYMREYWVEVHKSPIVYRYIDWSITVPLQMIEFNLILKAAGKPVTAMMFWRLLIGTVAMLAFGFLGETHTIEVWMGFVLGMLGWFFILYEIFFGEAGDVSTDCSKAVRWSFNAMRIIVTAGWSIYPLGYVFGLMLGQVNDEMLNIVYNIADFINKIAFVLACWSAAKSDKGTSSSIEMERDAEKGPATDRLLSGRESAGSDTD